MALTLQQYAAETQDPLRQGLVDMMWKSSRIMPILNFIQWNGISYPYSKRSKRPGVGTRGFNGLFSIAPGGYAPDVETLAILGGKVQTDSMLSETKPMLRENEIAGTMEAAGLMFDRLFFQGNPAATGRSGEFYGLAARMLASQKIVNAVNGAPATVANVNALLDLVAGPNSQKALCWNRTNRRNVSANALTLAGGARLFEIGNQIGGDSYPTYNGARIVEVEKDENDNEILPFNETCGSSSLCSSIYCIRIGGAVDERDVQGIISSKLTVSPNINFGEYSQDVIQMFGGIGVFGGYSMAQLTGCTAS